MFEVIKKSILAGIGVLAFTEEKVQEIIDDFVQKGKLTQKEAESLMNEVQKVIHENKAKLTAMIDERVKYIIDELNLLTKDDLAEMEKNMKNDLTKVEKRLAKIEKQIKET
jgi:polyhydroxyalkanoate synthesis regulator phasin